MIVLGINFRKDRKTDKGYNCMNNTSQNVSLKIKRIVCCSVHSWCCAGALVWILLKIMAVGTEFLEMASRKNIPYYDFYHNSQQPVRQLSVFSKIFGDYPNHRSRYGRKSEQKKDARIQSMRNDGGSFAAITHKRAV